MKEIMYSLLRGLFFVVVTVLVCCVRIIGQQQTPQPDEFLVGGFIAAMHPEYKDSTLYSNYDQILECGLNSVWQYVKRTDPKNFTQLSQFPYIYAANDTSPNNALNQGNVDWISYFTHAKYFRWEAEGDENFPDDPGANRVGIKHNGVGHETADGWSCGEGTNGIGEYFIDGPHYTQYRRYVYTNRWLSNPLIYYNAVFRLKLVDPQEGSFEVAMLKVSVDTGSVDYGGVGEFPIDSLILTSDSLSTNYKEFTINYSYEDLMEECTGCSGHYPPPPGLDWIPMKEASNTPWIDFTKKVRFKVQKRSRVEVIVDYIEVYDGGRPYSIWENSFIGEFNYTQTVNRISVYNQDYDSLSNLEYYGTMDEPHTWDSFIPLKKVQHILDSINTGRDLLVHFYPGWENKRELVQNVLEKWFRIAQPKKLMFWYAPFSCWYETTEYCDPNPQEFTFYYLRKNLQHAHLQLPGFFVTLQTWGTWDIEEKEYSGYYKPTPAGLIAETMLALAHGTEGIFYEVYYSYYSKYNAITQEPEILVEGLVDVPENNFATTENWDTVKYLAARLEGILGETIMNIKYTATDEDNGYLRLARYLDYRVPTTDDSVKKDYLILETTNSGDTLNFHAGFFIDSTDLDNNYFLLANLITTGSKWVNIGLIPPVSGYANYRFRNVETEFDTTFHSTISIDKQFPSGEGYLYQVAPVVKYGGKLKYDETVTGEKSLLDSMIIEDGVTLNIDGTYSIYDNLTVYGDIVVSDGGLLDINPGVEIYFQNGATLTVYGELEAEGTQTDSIIFDGDDWGSITIDRITDNNQYHSALSYAKIRNGAGIQCLNGAELTIQNSLIEDCTQGIYIYKSEPIISSTDIINPLQNGVNTNCYGEAIRINDSEIKKDSSNPQYHQNQGIILGNSTDAEIFHNDIAGFYYGMYIGGGSVATFGEFEGSTYIPNNRVKECPRGIGVGWGAEMYGGLTE